MLKYHTTPSGTLFAELITDHVAICSADDILDIEGTTEEIGKDAGSDEARGKATYPAVMGLAAAKEEASVMMDEALGALAIFGAEADPLREIAKYIVKRKN